MTSRDERSGQHRVSLQVRELVEISRCPSVIGTTKRQVAAMFADEQPHLRPLPVGSGHCSTASPRDLGIEERFDSHAFPPRCTARTIGVPLEAPAVVARRAFPHVDIRRARPRLHLS